MNLEQLKANIRAGKYSDSDNIYCEVDGKYGVSATVRTEQADGVWVDTVGGFRARWGF